MIDPLQSLCFSLHANPGVYALLLGSGTSQAAGIPTGRQITNDLVRKVARLQGCDADPDPEKWFSARYGKSPAYSDLLATLGKTPEERQQVIRNYIEPNEQEREEGAKLPTSAHRAIAELVRLKYVRVIVTTNFDRLLETALAEAGITPTVLSTADQVRGALPLTHLECCVLKLHGDYLDPRILNTPEELARYPDSLSHLLDRILDEFGLVVCGWSSEEDNALRAAIERTPSRRFTTYWASRGEPGEKARRLIQLRSAEVLPIAGADEFFGALAEQVQSLEEYARPHPLSTEAAVASLKRYLSKPEYRIQLSDLVDKEVDRVLTAESVGGMAPEMRGDWIHAYSAMTVNLLALGVVAGYWSESAQLVVWKRALRRLHPGRPSSACTIDQLQSYPGAVLLYAIGMGAVANNRFKTLSELFDVVIDFPSDREYAIQVFLPAQGLSDLGAPAVDGRRASWSIWLHRLLADEGTRICGSKQAYDSTFDKLEVLLALGYMDRTEQRDWMRRRDFRKFDRIAPILSEMRQSMPQDPSYSPYVSSGLLRPGTALLNINALNDFATNN